MKNILLAILLLNAPTILAQERSRFNKSHLVGKWQIDSIQECHSYWTDSFPCFPKSKETILFTFEIKKNGNYSFHTSLRNVKGTYKVTNDSLIVKTKNRKLSQLFDENFLIENLTANEFVYVKDSSTEGGPAKIKYYCVRIE